MSSQCPSPSGFGPQINADISGAGVRISFYLQTLFLGCLTARSGSLDEISGSIYTLLITNLAMVITSFILGFREIPEITLQDALVVLYLLSMSWVTVIWSLASCSRFPESTKLLQFLSVMQSYLIFSLAMSVFATAPDFGQSPACNPRAIAVLFRPFPIIQAGRIVGFVIATACFLLYTYMTVRDYTPPVIKRVKKWISRTKPVKDTPAHVPTIPIAQLEEIRLPEPKKRITTEPNTYNRTTMIRSRQSSYQVPWDGTLMVSLVIIVIFWMLFVMNTELLIHWTNFYGPDDPSWQFGQILPMFLVLLPLVSMVSVFRKYGLKPLRRVTRPMEVSVV